MDDFVKGKLREWNLDVLAPQFEAEDIVKETLLMLDDVTIAILVPKIGLRLKFKKHLGELLVNICEVLMSSLEGREILASLEESSISLKHRRCMVRILVSHLMERVGENPTSETKNKLAASLVEQFPCLKDSQGKGYEAFYSRGRQHCPATGFLEERLRNVRKRVHHENRTSSDKQEACEEATSSGLVLPESRVSSERAAQLTEWLKNNVWPANQVAEYMRETAIHRAKWIKENGTKSLDEIVREYPRLLDTPGMISQDFSIIYPQHAEKLFETWILVFKDKILCFASQEKQAQALLTEVDKLPPDAEGDITMRLLPVILPTPLYKVGKKMFKPSFEENIKSFIDFQPVGTNMVEYLKNAEFSKPYPFILGLGDATQCSQAFTVIGGQALQQNTLLGAMDTCFKSFYILDINFPKQCAPVWEFLQTVVFKQPGTESPSTRLLHAFIFAWANCY
uniref:uncharacterized protein n=1 Tax=Centroberyx gerrardi TaxID=166262 RepID=UPI003AAF1029